MSGRLNMGKFEGRRLGNCGYINIDSYAIGSGTLIDLSGYVRSLTDAVFYLSSSF